MEQRQHGVDDLLAVGEAGHPRAALRRVRAQVAVGEHRALGHAGRAAGVLQQREVVGRRPRVRRRQRRARAGRSCSHDSAPRRGRGHAPRASRGPSRPAAAASTAACGGSAVVRSTAMIVRSCGRRARPAGASATTLSQAIATVAPWSSNWWCSSSRRVERVVLDDDRAEAQHRVERDHVLRAVRQHERHAVAAAHARVGERLRRAGDLVAELAVGRRGAVEVEGDVLGEAAYGGVEQVAERLVGDLDVARALPVRTGSARDGWWWA